MFTKKRRDEDNTAVGFDKEKKKRKKKNGCENNRFN
jgi:hypothetical protein